ncbi:MAG: hypothetical protein R3B06_16190 [Kofleriaceae bacterium]
MTRLLLSFVTALSVSSAACKGGSSSAAAPPQPPNGAPIAFVVEKFTPGADRDGKVAIKAYNFSDKTVARYTIAARFTDKDGAVLKVGVGTPFEKDAAWTSMSGRTYACKPKAWCQFEIEMIEVPAATAKAEVALTSAGALAADGATFEDDELWSSDKGMSDWPL